MQQNQALCRRQLSTPIFSLKREREREGRGVRDGQKVLEPISAFKNSLDIE